MTLNQTQLVAKEKIQSFKFQTENHSMIFIITYHLRGTNPVFFHYYKNILLTLLVSCS